MFETTAVIRGRSNIAGEQRDVVLCRTLQSFNLLQNDIKGYIQLLTREVLQFQKLMLQN